MSYVVLARKYRPRSFAEVVGQEVVTRTLEGAIREERIAHAYLLTGPRGTGKTTSARLFAKALNCVDGPTPEPCGTCERCTSIDAGSDVDVLEIDAASNTGVDHVRALREQAAYVPMRARFKIYIVDEMHMLSRPAFNALLKTLEEPPPHVKFLFATTDLHKVPDTIQSRCQVLRLSPLPEDLIARRLDEVLAAEGVHAEQGVTRDLARRARGAMRDALSLADQLLALVGSEPKLADCERLSSEGSGTRAAAVVEHLLAERRAELVATLATFDGDEAQLLSTLLDHLRGCLVAALCGADAPMLGAREERERRELAERGERIGTGRLELWLQELLQARERVRLLPTHARLILELTLLDLCRPESGVELSELAERLLALELRLGAASRADETPRAAEGRANPPANADPANQPAASAAPAPPPDVIRPAARPGTARVRTRSSADAWTGFLQELSLGSRGLAELLKRRGRLVKLEQGVARVQLSGLNDDERPMIEDRRNKAACTQAFGEAMGKRVEVVLEDATDARPGRQDPFTREVVDLFDGRVEE